MGEATTSLLCQKTFTKIRNAYCHLEQKYDLDQKDAGFKSNVEIGQERTRAYPFCAKHFTHMSCHVATCKEKKWKEGEEEERKGKGKGKGKGASNFGA